MFIQGYSKQFTYFEVHCLQSVMILGVISSPGVGPLCFIESKDTAVYQILDQFMLLSADKLHGDADFLFQQSVARAKTTTNWFADHDIINSLLYRGKCLMLFLT